MSANVSERDPDVQRNKRLRLNEEPERPVERSLSAPASRRRLLTRPFYVAGGVLNRVRRPAFYVFDQVSDVALQRDNILAKQREIGICVHRTRMGVKSLIVAELSAAAMRRRL